jgi:hypothetical protein
MIYHYWPLHEEGLTKVPEMIPFPGMLVFDLDGNIVVLLEQIPYFAKEVFKFFVLNSDQQVRPYGLLIDKFYVATSPEL